MSDRGSILAGFIKGFAGDARSQMAAREEEEREARKARMLEQLRISTEKELTEFRESRPGYQLELEGRRLTNESASERLRQDRELFPLDLEYKRQTVEFQRQDQARQAEAHAESMAASRESRAASRAARAAARAGDADNPRSRGNLNSRYNAVLGLMRDAGASPWELSRAEYQWQAAQSKSDAYKEAYITALANRFGTYAKSLATLPKVGDKD